MKKLIQITSLFFLLQLVFNPIVSATVDEPVIYFWTQEEAASLYGFEADYVKNTVRLPKDGYRYQPFCYKQTELEVLERFQLIDSFTVNNTSSTEVETQYNQVRLIRIDWDVDKEFSKNIVFKEAFFNQISESVQAEAKVQAVASLNEAYPATPVVVESGERMDINVYQQGARSSGILYWKKYSPSGSFIGIHSQKTIGNTAPIDAVTIDVIK